MRQKQNEGDQCPQCKKNKLGKAIAIELGHIFQLGTKYSDAQSAQFLDEDGKQKPMIMGCYGIGVSRVIATIIEKNYDEKGIIWPHEIAPFDVEILPLNVSESDTEILTLVDQYYRDLTSRNIDVLVDDRNESPGRKFNDADLIGIPIRIVLGKRNLAEGKVEIKLRKTNEVLLIHKDEALEKIKELLKKNV